MQRLLTLLNRLYTILNEKPTKFDKWCETIEEEARL